MRAIAPDGPSVVIDTTGVPELIERALEVAAPRARVVVVGIPPLGYAVGMEGVGFVNVLSFFSSSFCYLVVERLIKNDNRAESQSWAVWWAMRFRRW